MGGLVSRDRLVVRTLRCGRSNPGWNPGPGISFLNSIYLFIISGSVGLAMDILARLRFAKIRTMARANSPGMLPKRIKRYD